MDITNKAIEVSNRMQEIEYQLDCNDLDAREADTLRYEYADLEDQNHILNGYFDVRNKLNGLRAENEELKASIPNIKTDAVPRAEETTRELARPEWPQDENRIEIIGQNGNDGLHYDIES